MVDIKFYVSRETNQVELASMHAGGLVTCARGGRWTFARDSELEPFLTKHYTIWEFDWSTEDDTPGSGADIDPENEIEWEIPLIQRWMTGEQLTLADIVPTCLMLNLNARMLSELIDREKAVLFSRYGFGSQEKKLWNEVALDFGVTSDRVIEIALSALEHIHSNFNILFSRSQEDLELVSDGSVGEALENLRYASATIWRREIQPQDFITNRYSLDTLGFSALLYLATDFFDLENPGVMEVPEGSIEVALNLNTLAGSVSRRMLGRSNFDGFSTSNFFDLTEETWATLSDRSRLATERLEGLFDRQVPTHESGSEQLDDYEHQKLALDSQAQVRMTSWTIRELIDSLALVIQIVEALRPDEQFVSPSTCPLWFFLNPKQRNFGLLLEYLENELRRRKT